VDAWTLDWIYSLARSAHFTINDNDDIHGVFGMIEIVALTTYFILVAGYAMVVCDFG
jgi:hypothetical protein